MMVTCYEEIPLIKLHYPPITWFCEVMWHIKYFISPFALDQWLPWQVGNYHEGLPLINSNNVWTCVHEKSCDKLKVANSSATMLMVPMLMRMSLGGDILQEAPTQKFAWPLNEEVMWQIKYIISPPAKTYEHQTRQGVDLRREVSILSHIVIWSSEREVKW